MKEIATVVREKDVERVVVGLPRHMDGRMGESAEEALALARKLRELLPCEVVTWDERLTTGRGESSPTGKWPTDSRIEKDC
jgi:putative Holliday junction resolvase